MIPRIFFDIAGENNPTARYDLARPFIDEPWLVATDVRIMVRMPAALLTSDEVEAYQRGTRKLFLPDRTIKVWNAGVESLTKKPIALPTTVEDREICRSCYPKGEWSWPFIPPSVRYCEECEGEGWNWIMEGIKVGSVILNRKYVSLLIRHGVTAIFPSKEPNQPVYFKGEGFEGILMPYDPDQAAAYAAKRAAESAEPY